MQVIILIIDIKNIVIPCYTVYHNSNLSYFIFDLYFLKAGTQMKRKEEGQNNTPGGIEVFRL